ncbi:MAG: DNA primase [Nitrospinae bacterium]|nr:DNA primase [Nitrospinota bacterium]
MGRYITDELVEEIRVRSDIVDVISERILLKKSGANYKGICPFHHEKTPSLVVSPVKQIFHCFGCNTGGNVYQFIMKIENIPFPDAVLYLAKRYGINIPEQRIPGVNKNQKSILHDVNRLAVNFFHGQLLESPQGKVARKYLKGRGIKDDTTGLFNIGYATPSWDGIQLFFKEKGISVDIQKLAGLIKEREDGGGYVDKFRDRVIFPISDSEGNVVGFGGRVLHDEEQRPKYLNSPETPVYKKGDILYGLHLAKDLIRKNKEAFLVEGYFDLITMYQEGIKNVIATSGTALTENHMRLLKRYTDTMNLIFDGDDAGRSASARGGMILLNGGMKVRVVLLPSGKDPDSFVKEKKREGFLNIVKEAKPFMEYMIDQTIAESGIKDVNEKVDCIKKVLPFISGISNSVEKGIYIALLAEKTGVSERAILDEINKRSDKRVRGSGFEIKNSQPEVSNSDLQSITFNPCMRAERILIQLMLLDHKNIEKIKRDISPDDFIDRDMASISSILFTLSDKGDTITVSRVMDMLSEDRLKKIALELVLEDMEYHEVDKNISDCIKYIKKNRMGVKKLFNQLKMAVSEGNNEQFQKLHEQILKIKN